MHSNANMPLIHQQLIDWDQWWPMSLELFENDEEITKFMDIQKGIIIGDYKVWFTIDVNST